MFKKNKTSTLLNNGSEIPLIGYGTYMSPSSEETINNVRYALKTGYRLIDTAARYGNEHEVGEAIKNSKIKREDIFVTSKLWNDDQGHESTIKAFEESKKKLQLKYIDLYLIHWPVIKGKEEEWQKLNMESWEAMEDLYFNNEIKAIGVSNFEIIHLENILRICKIKPMVNQIEMHPGLNNTKLIKFCKKHNILVQAYAPLVHGKAGENPLLQKLAKKYNKSIAQICIRWCLQHGVIPLPKSSHKDRISSNFDVFDFKLSFFDMHKIDNDKYFSRLFSDPNKGK